MNIKAHSIVTDEDWIILEKEIEEYIGQNKKSPLMQIMKGTFEMAKESSTESERMDLIKQLMALSKSNSIREKFPIQWIKIPLPVGSGLKFSSNREFLEECFFPIFLEERIADMLIPCKKCKGFNETEVDDYIEKNYSQEDFLQELDETNYIIPEEIIEHGRDDVIWLANVEICKCPDFGHCDSCSQEMWSEPDCCSICKQFYFCEKCVRDYTAYGSLLECSECSNNLVENLSEYDESVEHEQIGYREGDGDIYDNRDDY
jgi:hypothetical protein